MTEQSTELVIAGIGEVVNLDKPREVAFALDAIRDLEWKLRAAKQDLTRALVHASQQEGSKTLRYEGVEVTVKGGSEVTYDAEEVYAGLLEVGMSPERASEVVVETVTRKVSAVEAKRVAAANPAYAAVIAQHMRVEEKPFTASVSRKGSS
jgi:hypothetical protein